jgi:hypothetical protein
MKATTALLVAFAACYVVQWADAGVDIEVLHKGKLLIPS